MGEELSTVAVLLGANRSLTTIASAIMAFHPDVTVLNHAFIRIFQDRANDFLIDPREPVQDHFVAAAHEMALGGERGAVGGHILHSHAFGDETLRNAYLDRFGWGAKPQSTCLLWKDATRVTNYVAEQGIDLAQVGAALPALRFVMMVRNPVDICISSIRKGYSARLVGEARKDDFDAVFNHMISVFAGFSGLAAARPDQFRYLYQDEMVDRDALIALCRFLDISADEGWLDDIGRLIHLRPSYPLPPGRKARLKARVHELIADEAVARRVAAQIV